MNEWKPIETAPKDGTPVLCVDRGPFPYVAEWAPIHRAWVGADGMFWEPYYWMDLPAPPLTKDAG